MNDQAAETPLLDLLRGVPEDGRAWYKHDSTNHQNVPYGRLCKRAADALEQAQGKVACSAAIEKGAVKALSTAAERIKQLEGKLKDAYETGYQDSANMFSLSDENVPEEMALGWQQYAGDSASPDST